MNEHLLNYEHSSALKELRFDEPCFGYYNTTWSKKNELLFPQYAGELENWNNTQHLCSAPLKQQFFKWARKKYGLYHSITYTDINKTDFDFTINDVCYSEILFETYEQAEDACINKIIEILKLK